MHAGQATMLDPRPAVSVMAAVQHAEVVARRVGEPFGPLVLAVAVAVAVAVTEIEVVLIVSLMLADLQPGAAPGGATAALARDTVFAAIRIVGNGVVGLCILVGGITPRVLVF